VYKTKNKTQTDKSRNHSFWAGITYIVEGSRARLRHGHRGRTTTPAIARSTISTGTPAISLPMAVSDNGLPVGQFAMPPGGEALLLALACQLEA